MVKKRCNFKCCKNEIENKKVPDEKNGRGFVRHGVNDNNNEEYKKTHG